MKIMMRCYGQDPGGFGDPYTGDCDYAVLEVTPQLLEKIRRRAKLLRDLHQRDGEIWSVTWWDYTVAYYSWDLCEALENAGKDLDPLDDKEFPELPEGFDLELIEPQRTEIGQMDMLFYPGGPWHVFLRLRNVSRQRRPRSLRVPPLTLRRPESRCGRSRHAGRPLCPHNLVR